MFGDIDASYQLLAEKLETGEVAVVNTKVEKGITVNPEVTPLMQDASLRMRFDSLVFYQELVDDLIEAENDSSFNLFKLLGQTGTVEKLKARYLEHFQNYLVSELDKRLFEQFKNDFSFIKKLKMSRAEIDYQIAFYVQTMQPRILQMKLITEENKANIPSFTTVDPFILSNLYFTKNQLLDMSGEDIKQLNEIYKVAIDWNQDIKFRYANEQKKKLEELFLDIMREGSSDLSWIVNWANLEYEVEKTTLDGFWLGSLDLSDKYFVPGAYTSFASKGIDDFLVNLKQVANEEGGLIERVESFQTSYTINYIEAWRRFALNAHKGLDRLQTRDEWLAMIQQLTGGQNPFFVMLDKIAFETKPLLDGKFLEKASKKESLYSSLLGKLGSTDTGGDSGLTLPELGEPQTIELETGEIQAIADVEDPNANKQQVEVEVPEWIRLANYYQTVKQLGEQTEEGKKPGAVVNKKAVKLASKFAGKAGKAGKIVKKVAKNKALKKTLKSKQKGKSTDELNNKIEDVAKELDNFIVGLNDAAFQATNTDSLFAAIKTVYEGNGGEETAPILGPLNKALKAMQVIIGIENEANKPFWHQFQGAIYSLQKFMLLESQELLNDLWNTRIYSQLQGVEEGKPQQDLLFNSSSGLYWQFQEEYILNFIEVSDNGNYYPKKYNNLSVGFVDEYVGFVNKGLSGLKEKLASFPLTIETFPTSVNPESLFRPIKTSLTINCEQTSFAVSNQNFQSKDFFEWNESCKKASLVINFSVFSAIKSFDFDEFVSISEENGSIILSPEDFPEQETNLRDINVKRIIVNIKFSNASKFLAQFNIFPKTIPQKIAANWDDYRKEIIEKTQNQEI